MKHIDSVCKIQRAVVSCPQITTSGRGSLGCPRVVVFRVKRNKNRILEEDATGDAGRVRLRRALPVIVGARGDSAGEERIKEVGAEDSDGGNED